MHLSASPGHWRPGPMHHVASGEALVACKTRTERGGLSARAVSKISRRDVSDPFAARSIRE